MIGFGRSTRTVKMLFIRIWAVLISPFLVRGSLATFHEAPTPNTQHQHQHHRMSIIHPSLTAQAANNQRLVNAPCLICLFWVAVSFLPSILRVITMMERKLPAYSTCTQIYDLRTDLKSPWSWWIVTNFCLKYLYRITCCKSPTAVVNYLQC